jgi:hypothetical protein
MRFPLALRTLVLLALVAASTLLIVQADALGGAPINAVMFW